MGDAAPDAQHPRTGRPAALVTGGAVRVGRAIALRLAEAGYDVAISYRGSEKAARQTVEQIEGHGVRGAALQADLSEPAVASMLAPRAAEALSRLDLVVSSASVFYRTPLGGVAPEEWDDLFAVNARGPFFVAQGAVPYLKYDDPSIIHILDAGITRPFPGYIPYCASKAALEAVTMGLARALAPKVRVNAVAPGPVLAPAEYDATAVAKAAATTLAGRWGTPEDVAEAVLYLARARYTTGVVLPVDGGRRAK